MRIILTLHLYKSNEFADARQARPENHYYLLFRLRQRFSLVA